MDGHTLRNLRESRGLSQRDLASLLGVTDPTIGRWENESTEVPGPAKKLLELFFHGTPPFPGSGLPPGSISLSRINFTMEEWEAVSRAAQRKGFPDVRSYIVHITRERLHLIQRGYEFPEDLAPKLNEDPPIPFSKQTEKPA